MTERERFNKDWNHSIPAHQAKANLEWFDEQMNMLNTGGILLTSNGAYKKETK